MNAPPPSKLVVLVDTNVIIEAVRTGCWNALTGGRRVETVEECRDESMRGDTLSHGYVPVSNDDLSRIHAVHSVTDSQRAPFYEAYPDGITLDPGERDLFAHAHTRMAGGDDVWILCSADAACVKAAVALSWGDNLKSLEALANAVGTPPCRALERWHTERWLSETRTRFLLF